jgi:peptidyl-prolyl cis-trans isomerase SurA
VAFTHEWGPRGEQQSGSQRFDKDQLKASDYNMLKNLKEGEISAAFESRDNEGREGNVVYKIIKLEKIIPSHNANLKMIITSFRYGQQ